MESMDKAVTNKKNIYNLFLLNAIFYLRWLTSSLARGCCPSIFLYANPKLQSGLLTMNENLLVSPLIPIKLSP